MVISLQVFSNEYNPVNQSIAFENPIEGIEFYTETKGEDVLLSWNILDYNQVESVEVQRSLDGNNFIPVYQTYSISKQSNYSDILFGKPSSTLYYRLHVTFTDGQEKTSDVKVVDLDEGRHLKPLIYSNNSTTTIEFYSKENTETLVHIFNMTSRMIEDKSMVAQQGNNRIEFNTSNLRRGLYFLRITQGNETTTTKFFVQ